MLRFSCLLHETWWTSLAAFWVLVDNTDWVPEFIYIHIQSIIAFYTNRCSKKEYHLNTKAGLPRKTDRSAVDIWFSRKWRKRENIKIPSQAINPFNANGTWRGFFYWFSHDKSYISSMNQDIRSHQRFSHFSQALESLSEAVGQDWLNELEQSGLIQRFEFTLELGWKTLKDFLEEEWFQIASPKETIRQAFQAGYIDDAQIWIDMIDLRNTFSHDYDGNIFHEKESFLRWEAFWALVQLSVFFSSRLQND